MPPHLHPRSRMTSSLFATTVVASFLVVGLPHLLPCPAPRVAYADAACDPDGNRRRARRRSPQDTAQVKDGIAQFDDVIDPRKNTSSPTTANPSSIITTTTTPAGDEGGSERTEEASVPTANASTPPRGKRECPVPKPGGVIGELMGFKKGEIPPTKENTVEKVTIRSDR